MPLVLEVLISCLIGAAAAVVIHLRARVVRHRPSPAFPSAELVEAAAAVVRAHRPHDADRFTHLVFSFFEPGDPWLARVTFAAADRHGSTLVDLGARSPDTADGGAAELAATTRRLHALLTELRYPVGTLTVPLRRR